MPIGGEARSSKKSVDGFWAMQSLTIDFAGKNTINMLELQKTNSLYC